MAFSRRDFLKRTCCTAAAAFSAASFQRFGLVNALAQSAQDYKALVCIFMFGGNDANNLIVPASSARLRQLRTDPASSALSPRRACCRSIRPAPARLVPPEDGGNGVIVQQQPRRCPGQRGHAGTADHARDQFQHGGAQLPSNLFSHENQQQQMQTATLNGRP